MYLTLYKFLEKNKKRVGVRGGSHNVLRRWKSMLHKEKRRDRGNGGRVTTEKL